MRVLALSVVLASAARANPVPQGIDWAAVAAVQPQATPTIPVVNAAAAETTMSFDPTAAYSSLFAAMLSEPTATSSKLIKRVDDSQCAVQPASDDTASNFLANTSYSSAATEAVTPSGWDLAFQDEQASSSGVMGYMGYAVLDSYDAETCAVNCDAIEGCMSSVDYERDPSTAPTEGCTDPPSEVIIKCVYYGAPVTEASATNEGQYIDDFEVVIAGSNGYINNSIATPAGYSGPTSLGNVAISAPNDCNGANTYMGVKIFSGPFDVSMCAAACSAQSEYNIENPPADAAPMTCQFFNTYVLYNDSVAVGQYCALYNETWSSNFATFTGQYRGSDYFSVGYSYTFSNSREAWLLADAATSLIQLRLIVSVFASVLRSRDG